MDNNNTVMAYGRNNLNMTIIYITQKERLYDILHYHTRDRNKSFSWLFCKQLSKTGCNTLKAHSVFSDI